MHLFSPNIWRAIIVHPIRTALSMFLFLSGLFLLISTATYSASDVSFFVFSSNPVVISNFFGTMGAHASGLFIYLFGIHSFVFILNVLVLSFSLFKRTISISLDRFFGGSLLVFMGPLVSNLIDYDPVSKSVPGGLCGYKTVLFFNELLPYQSVLFFSVGLWLCGIILFLRIPVYHIILFLMRAPNALSVINKKKLAAQEALLWDADYDQVNVVSDYAIDMNQSELREDNSVSSQSVHHFDNEVDEEIVNNQRKACQYRPPNKSLFFKKNVSLKNTKVPENLYEQARVLEHKLERFGVKGKVSSIRQGPVVTLFEYEPDVDSKISKIIALEDDLALALQALSIRIIAPIPGKSVVGFEVANSTRKDVLFSNIIHSKAYSSSQYALPIVLGVDTVGAEVIVDLVRMPHLLVAGSTGSGKSVGLNTMLISLLCSLNPEELKLILIDPKRLEFAPYADIPHLIFPIVTNPKQASPVLGWVVNEMERRYSLMAKYGVRNSTDYQKQIGQSPDAETMPFIVVVIDELADLMMTAGKEIEGCIARIAQMARAAGIHMIVATQRPSVDVITGLIKANFPSRIAFRVSSRVDSRTIIDSTGANKLLGRGDMLFINSTDSLLHRVHGAYVSDGEIEQLMCYLKEQGEPDYLDISAMCSPVLPHENNADDELYSEIKKYLEEIDELSISSIQRKFRIGYNRSARIVEMLESEGLILPAQGGKMRKVVR